MKRRVGTYMIILGLLLCMVLPGTIAYGDGPDEEISTESETSGEDAKTALTMDELIEKIQNIDPEKLEEDLILIEKVAESEDFQSLIVYPQVREFVEMCGVKLYDFIEEEPELTAKICTTLGVDETTVLICLEAFKLVDENKEELQELIKSEEMNAAVATAQLLLGDDELIGHIFNIMEALGLC